MIKSKKQIRQEVKQTILSLQNKAQQSLCVCSQLRALIEARRPQCVALYAPLPDEVDVSALACGLDCRVVLPRVGDGEDGTPDMEFFDFAEGELSSGAYGIMEPSGNVPCVAKDIDFMVVPGVAFASDGRRLGRGKGYYDRYLSREGFRAYCVGVCFDCQLREDIPFEPHDRRVDEVVVAK